VSAILELRSIDKAFGSVVVADGLSLSLAAGVTVGVVGPNGAGKTSMLDLITGDLAPDRGAILFDGQDITRRPTHDRARLGIGRTHQIPRPFGAITVFENVLVGASFAGHGRNDRDAIAVSVDALRRTDLLAEANVLAGSLPLLDRKRLELARALASRPRVLLLDEIAGGLTEREVETLIGTIAAIRADGVTIVWIEHVVAALLSAVDRLVAINLGRVLADGEPAEVMASPKVQAIYLGQSIVA
jgi:branched-chain amino acid transport system ATP-binding protein